MWYQTERIQCSNNSLNISLRVWQPDGTSTGKENLSTGAHNLVSDITGGGVGLRGSGNLSRLQPARGYVVWARCSGSVRLFVLFFNQNNQTNKQTNEQENCYSIVPGDRFCGDHLRSHPTSCLDSRRDIAVKDDTHHSYWLAHFPGDGGDSRMK